MPGLQKFFFAALMVAVVSTARANVRCEAVFPSTELALAPIDKLRTNPAAAQKAVDLLQKLPVLISMRMADNLVHSLEVVNVLVPDKVTNLVYYSKKYNSPNGENYYFKSWDNAYLKKSLNNLEGTLSSEERQIIAEKMYGMLVTDFYLQPDQLADHSKLTDHLRSTAETYGLRDFNEAYTVRSQLVQILKLPNADSAIQEMLYLAIPDLGRAYARAHLNRGRRWAGAIASGAALGAGAIVASTGFLPVTAEVILPIIFMPAAAGFGSLFGGGIFTRGYANMKLKAMKYGITRSARKLISSGQIKETTQITDAEYTVVDADTSPLDQSFDRYTIENYTPRLADLKSSTIMDLGQEFWSASIALSARYSGLIYKHGDIDTALTAKIKKVVESRTSSQAETLQISKLLQHRRSQISQVAAGMDYLADDVNLTLQKLLDLQSFIQREASENPQLQGNSAGAQSAKVTLLKQLDSISQNIGDMNTMVNNIRMTHEFLGKEMDFVNLLGQTLVRTNMSRTGLSPDQLQKLTEFQQQLANAKLN